MSTIAEHKCSICFNAIGIDTNGWDGGHNAQPINNGRCCEVCNETVVIKARLQKFADSLSIKN
jgi:hypothetical protein